MTDQNRTKTLCEIFYQDSNTAISRQGRNQHKTAFLYQLPKTLKYVIGGDLFSLGVGISRP